MSSSRLFISEESTENLALSDVGGEHGRNLAQKSGIDCDSNRVDAFQEDLQKLIPNEIYEHDEDDEDVADADSDMKIILEALQKEEKGRKNQNKTFSDDRLKEIEKRNAYLMDRILAHGKRPNQYNSSARSSNGGPAMNSAAINRRKAQKKIDHENLILLRKIQTVKPFGMSLPK